MWQSGCDMSQEAAETKDDLQRPVRQALLRTKITVPILRGCLIERSRLTSQLDVDLSGCVTLISAPAGFGKTTLIMTWAARRNGRVAWLSLDESDNDPARFWQYVTAALQTVSENMGSRITAVLRNMSSPDWEMVVTQLINDLIKIPAGNAPITLVFDDYHLIHANSIHQSLSFLLHHQPPQLHVVILTRSDPPLALARLRVKGRLHELRAADLRFTIGEAGDFFRCVLPFDLSGATLKTLSERIEGWAAGLQLAALSLRGLSAAEADPFVQAFSGAQRYVLHFLLEEVYQRQPERIRDFLLQTAVLPTLNPSLCTAVTGYDDAGSILGQLAEQNLFVLPLDEAGQWYRYYRLFADALRSRLEQTQGHLIPELHRRAAAWYSEQGVGSALPDLGALLPDPLTGREVEVLEMIARGLSNQQIADTLVISVGTVKGHVTHLLDKLDAHSRTAAVVHAQRLGLLKT